MPRGPPPDQPGRDGAQGDPRIDLPVEPAVRPVRELPFSYDESCHAGLQIPGLAPINGYGFYRHLAVLNGSPDQQTSAEFRDYLRHGTGYVLYKRRALRLRARPWHDRRRYLPPFRTGQLTVIDCFSDGVFALRAVLSGFAPHLALERDCAISCYVVSGLAAPYGLPGGR